MLTMTHDSNAAQNWNEEQDHFDCACKCMSRYDLVV